jgi:hypothetical protein
VGYKLLSRYLTLAPGKNKKYELLSGEVQTYLPDRVLPLLQKPKQIKRQIKRVTRATFLDINFFYFKKRFNFKQYLNYGENNVYRYFKI